MPTAGMTSATVDGGSLVLVLLTGGGLTLVGTLLGAVVNQRFALQIGREARREERRLAVKSFQRDTLVALQDSVAELLDRRSAAWRPTDSEADRRTAVDAYEATALRIRMLASRVRDEPLRAAAHSLLEAEAKWNESRERQPFVHASVAGQMASAMRAMYDRAGELIRTLDEIEAAAD